MAEEQNQLNQLQLKLADLQKRQEQFHSEILQIRAEIERMKKEEVAPVSAKEVIVPDPVKIEVKQEVIKVVIEDHPAKKADTIKPEPAREPEYVISGKDDQTNLERFIGENLINKIGIAVTVIGVAIGAKYAIDHDLISPVTRIILGYLVGFGLLFFAVRLKKEYENFSAVLLSGSMAIMYFITYAAYSFFGLYPQVAAFILMVIFTAFTVTAALKYNRQVIAIIGLVGAYAVPFLLSDGTEKALILLSYVGIINIGILIISVKKYWKPLYFSAFVLSWLIFFSWFFSGHDAVKDSDTAFIFLFIYFATFYMTFLSYKLVMKEKFDVFDILLLLLNSFIFYGIGYSILKDSQQGEKFLGLLTLGNAIVHLVVSLVIYRNRLADRNLFYLVSGLFLVFITIAIPVQLDGNWVTLLWIFQAALLFFIGRTKNTPVYEYISYPLLVLSFLSLAQDWGDMLTKSLSTNPVYDINPVFNIGFLTSILFIAAFSVILYLYVNRKYINPFSGDVSLKGLVDYTLAALFLVVVYMAFRSEISAFWNHVYLSKAVDIQDSNLLTHKIYNEDLKSFKSIWLINYSLFFFAVISFVNIKFIKNDLIGIALFWLSFIALFIFLLQGLYLLSELRETYISQSQAEYFNRTWFSIAFRYISFVFVALSLAATYLWMRKSSGQDYFRVVFGITFHLALLWILSSEMLNIMDLLKNTHSYRFGLSILSGVYALMLIGLGISSRKKYLRIAAMVLFGATLAKLFFYDISRLDTILKTVLFLALGILMLIISFLYNKYKNRLFGESQV